MNFSETVLEFDQIKKQLCQHAVSEEAKKQLEAIRPLLSEEECTNKIRETTEARTILDQCGIPPLPAMEGISQLLLLCEKDALLLPEQLEKIALFLTSCKRMKQYLKKAEHSQSSIPDYGYSIFELPELQEEITKSIRHTSVLSSASASLYAIRRKIEQEENQIRKKLEDLLQSKKNIFSDSYVVQRNGKFVLPVKKECKNQIPGSVIEISGTGSTYFIEPAAVSKHQDKKQTLEIEEENEIRKILYTLTDAVISCASQIKINMEALVSLDFIFAKAKLSAEMKAVPASIHSEAAIVIKKGRHPLLHPEQCVPLDFAIGGTVRGIVITGPNTGGKTVALKTVGLLSLMAQSGLHVPADQAKFCIRQGIFCDIGDGQSISENLSTFSAHITNIIKILEAANQNSFVLLDELGSGTDPAEGMGIAIAILEELCRKNCLFLATTHYPEVKEFASQKTGVLNARMAFDRENLNPLYQLEIGTAGESCALYIAEKLGFPRHMLERAFQMAYDDTKEEKSESGEAEEPKKAEPDRTETVEAEMKIKGKGKEKEREREAISNLLNSDLKEPDRSSLPMEKKKASPFLIGDSVTIGSSDQEIGIVFQEMNEKGLVGVQIKGKKEWVNYKRIKLKVPAKELYPPDYDFSILFDSVEIRKARHKMQKKYSPDLMIEIAEPK